MASDIDPCRDSKKLENEAFATNLNGKTVKRVEDEGAQDAAKLIALESKALAYIQSTVDFPTDKFCRRVEDGAIFFDYYLNEVIEESFKVTILADYNFCVEMIGSILQEDGFYLLQEDDSQLLRE